MHLHWLDWLVIGTYIAFALFIGLYFTKRASQNVDEFFLSGRTLPWWLAGTSMVATSFAADTPLLISGWVRDWGIWKNWAWWCFAASGMLGTFLFARWWRRGEVMTKAELAELRYGGRGATALRGFLGVVHAGFLNTMILCWVILAAVKILGVLFAIDKVTATVLAAGIALTYSLMSGLWGVVFTDLVQFVIAVVGAVALAVISWNAPDVGGLAGVLAVPGITEGETLRFWPRPGEGPTFSASWWTTPVAACCVYLGVSWWAVESIDGSGTSVQRISATRDERHGMLAVLWFNVLHYALRPWPWIMVGLASLVVLPNLQLQAPSAGVIESVSEDSLTVTLLPGAILDDGGAVVGGEAPVVLDLAGIEGSDELWRARATVSAGAYVRAGEIVGKSDSERAYVVMMAKYLPVGLLGLVVASLLAAFMSTIDTHVNLASSFFVNDIYRRFIRRDAVPRHYVTVARLASVGVMTIAGLLTLQVASIGDLFLFFLAFLGGVGPVYILRWLWWRIRASTEITAVLASGTTTMLLTHLPIQWELGALSNRGALEPEGRLLIVVACSLAAAMLSMLFTKDPDPATLVAFYRKVRPLGWWGPVARLCPDVEPELCLPAVLAGIVGGLALIFGVMFASGNALLGHWQNAAVGGVTAVAGAVAVRWSIRRL